MESLLGFKEINNSNLDENHKLVPWLSWDEWDFVRDSLFSPSSPNSIAKALRRISAWRSRGCLPAVVDVTASIIEVQQIDPHFRASSSDGASDSEEMLAMLYSMAIMRLVNGVIEKTRKKTKTSIDQAAGAIGMPRMLIDIRHEGSHRDLPSLRLLRLASIKALNWLKSYYWDPQKDAIPYQRGESANIRKEIRSRLRELAFSLKVKQSSGSSSSRVKGKRGKHHDQLVGATVPGRSKFLSLMACKIQPSKYLGSRKQIARTLKNLARLYSFFSSDVVSVVLEFLLNASNSTDMVASPDKLHINLTLDVAQEVFVEWKPVITKFSKKEPELVLSLLKAVLDMIESRKAIRDDFGSEQFSLKQYDSETERIRVLSSLFSWLVQVLKALKSPHSLNEDQGSQTEAASSLPKSTLVELVRRSLRISDPENHELLSSALLLTKMVGSNPLNEKLQKLSSLFSLSSRLTEEIPSDMNHKEFVRQDKYIRQAAEKLELVKSRRMNNTISLKTQDDNGGNSSIWTVAKSWNPCPIGMLPRAVGSSGCLPVLDVDVDYEHKEALNSMEEEEELVELRHCGKHDASCDIETMENETNVTTRMREKQNLDIPDTGDTNVISSKSDGLKGRLLIDGVWQKVGDCELQDIKSRVCILVTRR